MVRTRVPAWRWIPVWRYSHDALYRHVLLWGYWIAFWGINRQHKVFTAFSTRATTPTTEGTE